VQSTHNRQGSEGCLDPAIGKRLTKRETELLKMTGTVYAERLLAGVAREQARKDLPLSTYTEAYWKMDLHNLLHFLELRMDPSAQLEIRQYAHTMGREIVRRWCPLTWEAFEDYSLNALFLSAHESAIVKAVQQNQKKEAVRLALKFEYLAEKDKTLKPTLEGKELEEKLKRMELAIPWVEGKS
jgi:thymidylate synthase (FAD)